MNGPLTCTPKFLPKEHLISAAQNAIRENPLNRPELRFLGALSPGFSPSPERIAVATTKYWHTNGVRLTVGFLDNPPVELRRRILLHMNAWSKTAQVEFLESSEDAQVRVARGAGGYWSYLGTDILLVSNDQQTMNLEGFTMATPDSEFYRVVRHETGHTLGCPHEHMRADLVKRIDVQKAITYYGETQGWDADQVRQQVLTPIDESSLIGTSDDATSIMCYEIPGVITKDGKPIIGGTDIDASDYEFMGKIYPKPLTPPAPSLAQVDRPLSTGLFSGESQAAEMIEVDLPSSARVRIPVNANPTVLKNVLSSLKELEA